MTRDARAWSGIKLDADYVPWKDTSSAALSCVLPCVFFFLCGISVVRVPRADRAFICDESPRDTREREREKSIESAAAAAVRGENVS